MGFVQILMTIKRRSHFSTFDSILAAHAIKAEPAPEAIAKDKRPFGADVFRLRAKSTSACWCWEDCQCGLLGIQGLRAIEKEKEKRARKGWKPEKIQRGWPRSRMEARGVMRSSWNSSDGWGCSAICWTADL